MKILIVSHNSFSTTHNNGKTLSAIFSAFQPEELCQLYFTPIGFPDYGRCGDYYLISDKDAVKSIILRRQCGNVVVKRHENYCQSKQSCNKTKSRPTKTKKFIRSIVWLLSSWYHGGLNKWLEAQKPNAIFYVGGDSFFSHRIAMKLTNELQVPLITYFTDDYVINPPEDLYNKILKHIYKKTIEKSTKLFAIGSQMADDYSVHYQREFKPIMNIVDIPSEVTSKVNISDKIAINYFGGLHLGRTQELMRFAQFMKNEVCGMLEKDYTIGIYSFAYTPDDVRKEMVELGITLNPGVTGDELKHIMQKTDILLHVESVLPEFRLLTKLSVSTKIPEYMSLAKPIIAFGPADVASFRVIADANPTMVIDDVDNAVKMREQAVHLGKILNSESEMSHISEQNYQYAKSHFDKGVVAQSFRKELEMIVL